MNKLAIHIKFYLLKNREKGGKHPLYCRISIRRKKSEFSMYEWIDPKKWNMEKETIKGNPELSAKLKATHLDLIAIRDRILEEGRVPTSKEVKDKYLMKGEASTDLIEYVSSFIDQMVSIGDRSDSTLKKYRTVVRHLIDFLESKSLSNVTLKGFTSVYAKEFELYLRTVPKLSNNTTVKYLKIVKTVFNRAIEFGLLEKNPLDHFKFKYERTNREFLTQEELNRLIEIDLPNDSLNRVRDLFLFACYTGLRFTDVGRLTRKNLTKDSKGKEYLELKTEKTNDFLRIPLLDKAKEIIDRQSDEVEITGRLLPLRSNQKVNAYLKVIADLCNIDKHLTFHMARHTFATTIALSNGMPMEALSKLLGHKDIVTTQVYGKIVDQYVDNQMEELNKKL
jgi:integrase